jgi:DNA primase
MSEIDDVKQRLNIVDIVGERVTLKKAGRNFKGLCPFHREKTPSFMVSPDRQAFHCFGCGKGGSVIDFVMEYEHVDFPEALEDLAQRAGVTLTKRAGQSPQDRFKEKIYEVNNLSSQFFHYILTKASVGERARAYLKNRGVRDASIQTFGIGYSPNNWEGLTKFLEKKGYSEKLLEESGLSVRGKRGLYDRFRGRVIFTLRDHRGRVVGFSGRVLDPLVKDLPALPAGRQAARQEAKYINSPETPVYVKGNVLFGLDVTKAAIQKESEAILMEGEFDVISSFQEGVGNVVAIKGSALTEQQVNLLKRYTSTLVFCLDSDVAGDAAARRGIEVAESAGLDMKVVTVRSGKDPDEAVRTDPVGFKHAVKSAVPIYDYFLSSVADRFQLTDPFGKKKAGAELLPILTRIANPIVQAHYVKKVAALLDVPEDSVIEGMKRVKPGVTDLAGATEKEKNDQPMTRFEKLEIYLLALLFADDVRKGFVELKKHFGTAGFSYLPAQQMFDVLGEYLGKTKDFDIETFSKGLASELVPVFDLICLWDLSDITGAKAKYEREWQKTIAEYEKLILRKKLKNLTDRVSHEEDAKDLEKEIADIGKRLVALEKSTQL